MKELIDAYLENQKQRIVEDIQSLVRIESVSGDTDGNRKALEFVRQKAALMGIPCKMTREEDVLLAQIGSGDEKVGILAHVDVVEPGDMEKWTYPPFSGYADDEFIWGRGSLDDKGGVIVSLYVLKALLDLKIPLNKQIWLIIGSDEEGGTWQDIEHFKRDFGVPDYGFSPDGDFNIFNVENGYADMVLEFTEPKREELVGLLAGESANTIPSKAEIQFRGQQAMEFHGVSAHSSTPKLGENAIEILCRELAYRQDLNFIRFVEHYLLGDYTGSQLGLNPEDKNPRGGSTGNTVCVPTILKLTDKGVVLNVNIRHKYGITKQEVLQQFENRAQDYGYSVRMTAYLQPMMVDENHAALQLMKSVYEEYGLKSYFKIGPGTSYAKSMENFVSWGPNFPEHVNCAHMEDEKISVRSLLTAAKIYTLFLARCAAKPSLTGINERKMNSLEKALYLLGLFAEEPYVFTASQLADRSGLNRVTIYRDLTILEARGYLIKNKADKSFSLGPMTYRLGSIYLNNAHYKEDILSILEEIGALTKESVGLARRENDRVISIYSVERHQAVTINDRPGFFYPMNKGTYGKGLMAYHDQERVREMLAKTRFAKTCKNTLTEPQEILAEYEKIRKQGYVISVDESSPYVAGVGVPLKGHSGTFRNIVSVSFFKKADYQEKIRSILQVLLRFKPELEKYLE